MMTITYVKQLWNWWKELKTWQQVCLLLPVIVLTAGLIFLLFSPIKPKSLKLEDHLLKQNKKVVDKQLSLLEIKEKELEDKQIKVEEKVNKNMKEIERKEEDAEQIIKDIDAAGDDINALLALHDRLNSRNTR